MASANVIVLILAFCVLLLSTEAFQPSCNARIITTAGGLGLKMVHFEESVVGNTAVPAVSNYQLKSQFASEARPNAIVIEADYVTCSH